jgi:hypothetical protein
MAAHSAAAEGFLQAAADQGGAGGAWRIAPLEMPVFDDRPPRQADRAEDVKPLVKHGQSDWIGGEVISKAAARSTMRVCPPSGRPYKQASASVLKVSADPIWAGSHRGSPPQARSKRLVVRGNFAGPIEATANGSQARCPLSGGAARRLWPAAR